MDETMDAFGWMLSATERGCSDLMGAPPNPKYIIIEETGTRIVVHPYDGIFLSREKEGDSDIHRNMDEP